jgi:hypothetical protein
LTPATVANGVRDAISIIRFPSDRARKSFAIGDGPVPLLMILSDYKQPPFGGSSGNRFVFVE